MSRKDAATPSKLFPGILPLAEAGLPGFDLRGWAGFVAPAKTPEATVALLNSKIVAALKEPDLQQALAKIGTQVGPPLSPAEFTTFVADDIKIWNKIIDVGGVPRGRAPTK